MSVDLLADALNKIKIYNRVGKRECVVKDTKLIRAVISLLKDNGYIDDFEQFEDEYKKPHLRLKLNGKINTINVIKPRVSVKYADWIKTEERYLPAYNIGILAVSTSKGVITNQEAKKYKIGGKLLAYVY